MPVVRQLYDSFMTFQTGYGCGEMVKEKWAGKMSSGNAQVYCYKQHMIMVMLI